MRINGGLSSIVGAKCLQSRVNTSGTSDQNVAHRISRRDTSSARLVVQLLKHCVPMVGVPRRTRMHFVGRSAPLHSVPHLKLRMIYFTILYNINAIRQWSSKVSNILMCSCHSFVIPRSFVTEAKQELAAKGFLSTGYTRCNFRNMSGTSTSATTNSHNHTMSTPK